MPYRLPQINRRVLTVVLLVGLPALIVGIAVVLSIGQVRLKEEQGDRLEEMAAYIAGSIDAYIFRSILDAAVLARVPEVRQAAAAASARPFDESAARATDREWQRDSAAAAKGSSLLESPASRFLADLSRDDPVHREILVTDRFGRLVAASNVTSDFLQSDESWWYRAYDSGRGRVTISDVRRDDSAGIYAFEIAVPVPALDGDAPAGIMKIVADSREMLAGIAGVEFGSTAEAILLRPNGTIVFRRRPHDPEDRFFAANLLREQLEARAQRQEPRGPIQLEAQAEDGSNRLVVLAPSQLVRSYPDLDWYVALSVDRDELVAPFQSLIWYLILVFAFTALAVLGIALWFSLRLATPTIDPEMDMHLVEHAADRKAAVEEE